ncbi:MAG: hypothetical protein R6U43_01305, partial [Candidatus Krumholzibacteriales bacterium]
MKYRRDCFSVTGMKVKGMSRSVFIILIILLTLPYLSFAQGSIPSSPRSREAISSVKPGLGKELEEQGMEYGAPIYIRIFKEERILELWVKKGSSFELFKTY